MRRFICFCLFLAIVPAAILVYSLRRPLRLYWEQWFSLQRHFVLKENTIKLRKPFLSNSTAKIDPEAADMAELIYQHYSSPPNFDVYEDVEAIAALSRKYPNNPCLLYALGRRLALRAYVDPQALRLIADELFRIDPQNSRFHLLYAIAAFSDGGEDWAEQAVFHLEQCFAGRQYDPYEPYQGRISRLIEKEKPVFPLRDDILFGLSDNHVLLEKLLDNLLSYTQDLIVNGQIQRAIRLHDRLQKTAENSIPLIRYFPWHTFYISLRPSCFLFVRNSPQQIELRWRPADPRHARQNRLEMLAWLVQSEASPAPQKPPKEPVRTAAKWSVYWLPLAGHTFQMTLICTVGVIIFFVSALAGKRRPSSVSPFSLFFAVVFFVLYLLACRGPEYLAEITKPCFCCSYCFEQIPFSYSILSLLALVKPFAVWGLAGSLLSVSAAVFLLRKKTALWGHLLLPPAVFAALLSLLLVVEPLPFAACFFDGIVFLTAVPVLCRPVKNLKQKTAFLFFGGSEATREFRSRCLKMAMFVWVLHFAVFALAAAALASETTAYAADWEYNCTWLPAHPAPYICDPNLYPPFIERCKSTPIHHYSHAGLFLSMIEPNDLPAVLSFLQERGEERPTEPTLFGPMMTESMCVSFRSPLANLASEIHYCGKDAWPMILPFIKDPNQLERLRLEEQIGSTAARRRLMELNKQMFTAEPPAGELLEGFNRQEKGELLEYWLTQAKSPHSVYTFFPILSLNAELTAESRRRLWREWIAGIVQEGSKFADLTLLERPADCHLSEEIVEECRTAEHERLRAYGYHRRRRIGKPLDETFWSQYAADPHAMVRAGAACWEPERLSPAEPSALVRRIAELKRISQN
ncbi:MAG TPA: hypothetical protein PLP49_05165 [Anaerohalosphaeraceae bacterium]|nr:hypothetical protein [Anaerohalosphaeraceae bacterium]HPB92692.1 hypothetical protein [Anaerohalosphaeraceae bacterium]HRT23025.1 hypothetical protein [Anaerohalosphaeraceae bacterium]